MEKQKQPEQGVGKNRKRKVLVWILSAAAIFVLLLFFGIPLFLSSSGGKSFLVNKINESVDGQVQMDTLSIGWFKGVRIENASFDDAAGTTSVQVKRFETQPKLAALLGGKVKLGKTVIENPRIHLKIASEPETAPAAARSKPGKSETKSESQFALPLDQIDLEVVNGQATIEMPGEPRQTISFTNIASKVVVAETAGPSTLALTMDVQDGQTPGRISANGSVDADKKSWTIKDGQFDVKISKLQLSSLKPLFALAGQPMDMAGELNADATAQLKNNQLSTLTANAVITDFAQGSGAQRTAFTDPVRLTAQAAQEGETLRVDKLNVRSGFLTVDASGTLENIKYSIRADDLGQVQKFAGQFTDLGGLGMQGTLAINGTVSMTDDAITVSSQGGAQKLVLSKEGVQTPVTDATLNVEGTYLTAKQELRIASANVTSTPATVKVSNLVLPLAEQEGPKTISLDASTQMDLAKVWPFIQVFAETPKGMTLAGMMNAGVKVTTTGNELRLLTDDTAISQLKITQPDSEPFVQEKVTLKADILMNTEDKTIDIKALNLQGAQGQQLIQVTKGKVEKTVSQNMTSVKGDFEATYDLKALTSFAAAFMPQGLTMEGQRKCFFQYDSRYPTDKPELMAANLNGKGSLGFDAANFMGLKFGPTDLNLTIQKGLMQFELPDAKVNEGILRLAAQVNLAEEKKTLQLTKSMKVLDNIHLDDELTKNLLESLNPMFAKQTNVTGIASLDCSTLSIPLSSPMDKGDILLDATVAMSNVNLKATGIAGQILSVIDNRSSWTAELKPTQLQMQKGTLQYKNMEFVLDTYPLGFSGRILLNQAVPAADLTVAVPYTIEGKTVHASDDLTTRLSVPLKGPLASLKVDTASMIKKGLQQTVEKELQKELQKGLEGIFKK
jgi:hypothetical protein